MYGKNSVDMQFYEKYEAHKKYWGRKNKATQTITEISKTVQKYHGYLLLNQNTTLYCKVLYKRCQNFEDCGDILLIKN